jgi:hypothetical protein
MTAAQLLAFDEKSLIHLFGNNEGGATLNLNNLLKAA